MKIETSCGAVVFTIRDGEPLYLIIKQLNGVVGFPKGHVEGAETEQETALREISEETGLSVTLVPGFRAEDEYPLPNKTDVLKRVVFFLARCGSDDIEVQEEELSSAEFVAFEDAERLINFESSRNILRAADAFIRKNSEKL